MLKNKLVSLQLDGKSSLRDSCTGPKNKAGGNGSAGAGWELGLSPGTLQAASWLVSHIYYLVL